jgi:hypothetical protein
MTQEWSGFWTTSGVGDGVDTGYTQTQLATLLHALAAGGDADTGVEPDYGDALAVAAGTEKVTMGTGMAAVYGYLYVNPVDIDFTVISPVASTRIDRVVLRADWNTQTVRAVVLNGAEGGSAPSLTQSSGSVWEIPIAQFSVTVGGTITVTDQRKFLGGSADTPETSKATPLTLVLRDANARAKIGAPSVASDIARKDTVDNHAALKGSDYVHGSTPAATPGALIARDGAGRARVEPPAVGADIARLDTVTGALGLVANAQTTYAAGELSVATSCINIATVSGIVTTGTTLLLILGDALLKGTSGNGIGTFFHMRAVVNAGTLLEERGVGVNENNTIGLGSHWAQVVSAGTHSVALQVYSNNAGKVSLRRLTVLAIKTGA